jgi:nucleoid-associated protein YgaU
MSKKYILLLLLIIVVADFIAILSIKIDKNNDQNTSIVNQTEEERPEQNKESNDGKPDIDVSGAYTYRPPEQSPKVGSPKSKLWKANNYKKGDIKTRIYTVKSGDTLWEISEGYYGKGAYWTKIRNANKTKVKSSKNGHKIMIYPGQKLQLG